MKKRDTFSKVCFVIMLASLIIAAVFAFIGVKDINRAIGNISKVGEYSFYRTTTAEEEGYEDETLCPVEYETADGEYTCIVTYTYDEWENLSDTDVEIKATVYTEDIGNYSAGMYGEYSEAAFVQTLRDTFADEANTKFMIAIAAFLLFCGFAIMAFWGHFFTTYEKIWFLGIMVLAAVVSLIFPEESSSGVNGIWIMLLYLIDTFLNVLCELLISKQSKWNFIVSVFVEITEILICIVLAYRFATMVSTLFFWLPCDIISFINWNKKKDTDDEELTKVRTLKGWQEVLIIVGIIVWTVVIGYLLTLISNGADIFHGNRVREIIVCYVDACATAVGIANGLAILFRYREQWIAWYIEAICEAVINILAGQYVLLVLKFGYLTNTTYGYIKWTKYIKSHPGVVEEKTFF